VSTDPSNRSILVIEDDSAIAEVLTYNLEREGYQVARASDGRDGMRQVRQNKPDLVVLDLMLPGMDGIEICREIRADKETRHIAILMLTAKSEESDQLVGFHLGADDYVTKPFSLKVLLQRIRVLMSRRQKPAGETEDFIQLHGIKLDRVAHQVFHEEVPLALTPTEYRLLETMMRQPGRAFTRNDLLNSAIGTDTIVLERTIDVHVRSLRQKLGEGAITIETVRGIGYRFARELPARTENA
jgi:two-component system phosphate regulon response regulator PhoB